MSDSTIKTGSAVSKVFVIIFIIISFIAIIFALKKASDSFSNNNESSSNQYVNNTETEISTEIQGTLYYLEPGAEPIIIDTNGQYIDIDIDYVEGDDLDDYNHPYQSLEIKVVKSTGKETEWREIANTDYNLPSAASTDQIWFRVQSGRPPVLITIKI
jgi:hypothetical protein